MLHTIQNDLLTCSVSSNGSEIRSLKKKETDKEYIWQIDESVWASSSPVLFPAIGKIKGDKITYNGKDYAMTKHGIIRHNDDMLFEQHSDSKCSFTLNSSPETLVKYPFMFSFTVVYELVSNQLKMTYHIKNKGDVPMYFSCGGHTAYACPLTNGKKLEDYVIEFPNGKSLKAVTLGDSGLLSDEIRKIPIENSALPLSKTLFDRDALIFVNVDYDWVRLRACLPDRQESGKNKGLMVKFEGYPNLALWSKPGADYVCIEPWLGLPDSEDESTEISEKSSYQSIAAGSQFSITITTIVE
ncbi:Galactose mutarotase [Nonlabens sp. Hel1_33_55]|uniref:aldose 1-epimerase family protein n=1 Tax=Nonlabens sp. Hel1_33_55 TaxID=1336802 RepID=UPI000875EC32|nr:aldose 1-epimerase family protein [Nonlabens sp. Hel1_33_55]SCY02461.1 Galactose mutarotase [Nonlabens sp. Hel1_33_55]